MHPSEAEAPGLAPLGFKLECWCGLLGFDCWNVGVVVCGSWDFGVVGLNLGQD